MFSILGPNLQRNALVSRSGNFAIVSGHKCIKKYSLVSRSEIIFLPYPNFIDSLIWAENEEHFFACEFDPPCDIVRFRTLLLLEDRRFPGVGVRVQAPLLLDNFHLFAPSVNDFISLWDIKAQSSPLIVPHNMTIHSSIAYGEGVMTGCGLGNLSIWSKQLEVTKNVHFQFKIFCLKISDKWGFIIAGSDNSVALISKDKLQLVQTFDANFNDIRSMTLWFQDELLFFGGKGKKIYQLAIRTGETSKIGSHRNWVIKVDILWGNTLLSSSYDGGMDLRRLKPALNAPNYYRTRGDRKTFSRKKLLKTIRL